MVSLIPGSNILIMAPNYNLAIISFELQRTLIKHFDLEVEKDNAKDKVIQLCNGSTVRMGSVNQVDSVVGRSYDLIIFDEAALTDAGEEAFNVALRPTLDKDGSKALFISTPRGRNNWFSKFYDRGFDPKFPEWVSIKATWHENPRISASDIDEARRTMSDAEFRQEYEADFNIFEGQIWNFNFEKCVQDLSMLDVSRMDVIAGLDIGWRDPTTLCIIAYDWDTQMYYILDEYMDKEKTTEQQATEIKKMLDKWDVDFAFIDSAAQQTRFDFAQMYDISTNNAKKSLTDGIGFVASIVDNDRLIVDTHCIECLKSLDQYKWDPNPNLLKEKPAHDDFCHMADSIRYAMYSFETSMITV
jgi:phage terminase large subunit